MRSVGHEGSQFLILTISKEHSVSLKIQTAFEFKQHSAISFQIIFVLYPHCIQDYKQYILGKLKLYCQNKKLKNVQTSL